MKRKIKKQEKHIGKTLYVILLTTVLISVSGCGKSDEALCDDRAADSEYGIISPDVEESPGEYKTDADRADQPGDGRNPGVDQNGEGQPEDEAGKPDINQDGGAQSGGQAGGAADGTADAAAVTDFGLRLLQKCMNDPAVSRQTSQQDIGQGGQQPGYQAVSPLSALSALAMTGYGASGETLNQMEETFGLTVPELSACLSGLGAGVTSGEEKCRLNMACGIWFTEDEDFTVEQEFLQKCADFSGAEVGRVSFDISALEEINGWVEKKTEGMIPEILDEIPADAVMYLVNALAFDGEWEEIYREYQVREGDFTRADGTVQKAEMMYSEEGQYLQDENASGFLKYYAGRKYAYAALLPREGMDVWDYVASLNGQKLHQILTDPLQAQVQAAVPRYESEYGVELGDILQEMGITDAFEPARADFSGIGHSADGNIFISRVLHKTFIAVDERGTKAGASTAVEMREEGAAEADIRTVYLDRPFFYMIVDCEENLPVFMGVVTEVRQPGR